MVWFSLESQGGEKFFGEPALNLDDLIQTDCNGQGIINILAADKLIGAPKVYTTLLWWLLSELYERLPEVGDLAKPKLVLFFDEAHLLFSDMAPSLLEKVEQVVRLIRSKGVGVYFVTQIRATFRTTCSANSGTESNMRRGYSPLVTRSPLKWRPKRSEPIQKLIR